MIEVNFTEKDEFIQLNIKAADKARKQITFDSDRCNGILLAYKDKAEIEQFMDSLNDIELPNNIDLIELDISSPEAEDTDSLIDSVVDSINENTSQDITTFIFLKDATTINTDLINLMRFRRDGTVKLLSFIDESQINTKTGMVKCYKLVDLNDPFIFQIVVYLDDDTDKVYDTKMFYRNGTRRK